MNKTHLIIIVLLSAVLTSCWNSKTAYDPIKDKVTIHRFDRLVDEYVNNASLSSKQQITMDYQRPTQILIENVLMIGKVDDDNILQRLSSYYKDTTVVRLSKDINKKFQNLSELESSLSKAFYYIRKNIPTVKRPYIYTQNSALNESIIVEDSLIGISLDKYMGRDYSLYKQFYHDYQLVTMSPDRIKSDCLLYYLVGQTQRPDYKDVKLLGMLMHYGKIVYIANKALKNESLAKTMGYTEKEEKWLKDNESRMWRHLQNTGELEQAYSHSMRNYMRPVSVTLFNGESPQMPGIWIGGRIIEKYMSNNRDVKLKDLLYDSDYKTMFERSGYMKFH